jgi:hypothetical protein
VICYFCMTRPATRKTADGYYLCDPCNKSRKDAGNLDLKEVVKIAPTPWPKASDICQKCGVCCFMLNIVETKEVFDKVVQAHKINPHRFGIDTGMELDGKPMVQIKTPCMFLGGKVLEYTWCRIHDGPRPTVCPPYMCTVALEYSLGRVSLEEGLFQLRSAFISGDRAIFNDFKTPASKTLFLAGCLRKRVTEMKGQGMDDEQIRNELAILATPTFDFADEPSRFVMCMHLDVCDRGDFDPKLFFDTETISRWHQDEHALVVKTIEAVMTEIRQYFVKTRPPIINVHNKEDGSGREGDDGDAQVGPTGPAPGAAQGEAEGSDSEAVRGAAEDDRAAGGPPVEGDHGAPGGDDPDDGSSSSGQGGLRLHEEPGSSGGDQGRADRVLQEVGGRGQDSPGPVPEGDRPDPDEHPHPGAEGEDQSLTKAPDPTATKGGLVPTVYAVKHQPLNWQPGLLEVCGMSLEEHVERVIRWHEIHASPETQELIGRLREVLKKGGK